MRLCRCEYIVESGERYVGEWEEGKPKWVQSLGDDSMQTEKLSEEMQAKVATALQVLLSQCQACVAAAHVLVTCHVRVMRLFISAAWCTAPYAASCVAEPHEFAQIAEQAREAAAKSQQLAAEHWDIKCKAQTMVQRAVDLADDASVKAQQARGRAMVLAHKLDVLVQRHVGEHGWPMSEGDEK